MVLVCEGNLTTFIFVGVLRFTGNCFESFPCYIIITPEKLRYNITLYVFVVKSLLFANYFSLGAPANDKEKCLYQDINPKLTVILGQ